MKLDKAIMVAKKTAKARNDEIYVVIDHDGYEISTAYELDTSFAGAPVIFEVYADGSVLGH